MIWLLLGRDGDVLDCMFRLCSVLLVSGSSVVCFRCTAVTVPSVQWSLRSDVDVLRVELTDCWLREGNGVTFLAECRI